MNLVWMHLPVDQAATASSESLALSICFTPDMHGILSGILWEPLCLGHAKAKTPRLRANLSRRTGLAVGSKLRRIPGWVVSRGGWRCPGHSNEWLLLLPLPFCQAQWLLLVPWRTGTAHVILSLMFFTKGSVSYLSSPCFSTSLGGIGGQPTEFVEFSPLCIGYQL